MALEKSDLAFTGRIPELYERYMVPLLFEPYARDLAARVLAEAPDQILELGCGTGVVTRHLAKRLGDRQRMTVTDLSADMLEEAKRGLDQDPRLDWQPADAAALPLESASCDLAFCQFAVMFFPDKVAAYREIRRVLRPAAPFLFNAWDSLEANGLAELVIEAAGRAFPDDPPRFLARTPHGYADPEAMRHDLGAAGFQEIEITIREETSRAATAYDAAFALVQCTPLRGEIEARDAGRLDAVTQAAAAAIAKRFGEPVAAPMRAFLVRAA